jgi:predicted SnoaL-like aldol condensation-catalyzing enzyme
MSEVNKRKVRLFVDAVVNEGRLELIDELVADDFIGRAPGVGFGVVGRAGVRRLVTNRRRADPDLYVKIEDQIAEDDRVVTRWRTVGGGRRSPSWAGISIVRLVAGKQVDAHTELGRSDVTSVDVGR